MRRSQPTEDRPRTPDQELRGRLAFSDRALLDECQVHTYRASGPGGQKRNKTSSAVRLHHAPSGLIVTATESRSQHENRARALRRLREAIALTARLPLPTPLQWPDGVAVVDRQLKVGPKNPALVHVIALVLDAIATAGGRVSEAASALELTASSLTRWLAGRPKIWAEANRIRAAAGLPLLKQPR